ncbi:MAG: tetratricopeptide repeat protein [Saprospiraceae bacterium]|nr:tetratricopeptide repeat protein [Saprospiraceae bacterium]
MKQILFAIILCSIGGSVAAQEEVIAALEIINAGEENVSLDLSGINQLYRAGQNKEALSALKNWKAQYPNNVDVLLLEGQILMDQKKYKPAMKNFDQVLLIDGNNARAYYLRGLVKDLNKKPLEAIVEFSQAILLKPDYSLPYEARGTTKSKLGDHFSAIEDFDKAIELNEDLTLAYMGRGLALHETGQFDKAANDFHVVVKRESKNALAVYYRGLSKVKKGDNAGCKDLGRAYAMGITNASIELQKYCQ